MQKRFVLFIVLAFGLLMLNSYVAIWLKKDGQLTATVEKGLDVKDAKLLIQLADETREVDIKDGTPFSLRPGPYQLELTGGPADLGLRIDDEFVEPVKNDEGKNYYQAFIQSEVETKVTIAKREPKKPDDKALAKVDGKKDGKNDKNDKTDKPDTKSSGDKTVKNGNDKAPPDNPPVNPPGVVKRERVTLGSLDPASGYRYLATLDNRGATVERIELNDPKYHDLEDRGGYLGQLAATDAAADGAVVNVVGAGTPADEAGLRPGDVITAVNGNPVKSAGALSEQLAKTRPKREITLTVTRNGQPVELTAKLARPPLQIVRPELENSIARRDPAALGGGHPSSYRMTLLKIGDEKLGEKQTELAGVDLLDGTWEVLRDEKQPEQVTFRRALSGRNLEVTKTYRAVKSDGETSDDAYHLELEIGVKNVGQKEAAIVYQLDGPTGVVTEGAWYVARGLRDYFVGRRESGKLRHDLAAGTTIAKEPEDTAYVRQNDETPLAYLGIDTQYFAAAVIPKDDSVSAGTRPLIIGDSAGKSGMLSNLSCRMTSQETKLAPGKALAHEFILFAGPKKPDVLAQETYRLDWLIDYGWFEYVAKPMAWILDRFYWLVGNYGIAIILLTVLVRSCMFPISRKQAIGAQKMQAIQPEMKRIREQYKGQTEQLGKAMRELFQKHNYNPYAGCLPLFIQLPIFIGLYRALNIDIELRQAPLLLTGWWCDNLAAPDMLLDWSAWLPSFLQQGVWFIPGLGPYLNILPIVTVVLFLVQQKMFMPPAVDEQAAMQMKIMTYMMVFMGLLFYKVASGLCVYFIASSLWSIAERKILPKKTAATADAAKTSPIRATPTNGFANRRKRKQKGRR